MYAPSLPVLSIDASAPTDAFVVLLIQETWANTFNESELKDFAARADIAESAFLAACERYNRREVPQDAWESVLSRLGSQSMSV